MGPWSGQATSWLGETIAMRIDMAECVRVEAPKGFPLTSISNMSGFIVPKVNGDVILDTMPEPSTQSAEEDAFGCSLSDERRADILKACVDLVSDLSEARMIEHRGDLLAWPPGAPGFEKPVIGRMGRWENAYLATRMGGTGILLAAGTGEIMAEMLTQHQAPYRMRRMMDFLSPTPP